MFEKNRICELFGIEYPVISGGMVWVSGGKLAAAVSEAGGLGLIGSGSMKPDLLREHIRKAKSLTNKPVGVNIPMLREDSAELVSVAYSEGIKIVFTSAGSPKRFTPILHEHGCTVVHVVPEVKFAKKVEDAGRDAVVAEGFEAGGHNGVNGVTTFVLTPQVADAVNIPVIAAGGITDGRGITAALALGADGVQIGTRFAATIESSAHDNYKQAVLNAADISTVYLLRKIGPSRVITNEWTNRVIDAENKGATPEELRELLGQKRERLGIFEGDIAEGQVEAGQGAGLIKDIPSVSDLMKRMINGYRDAIKKI